MTPSTPSQPPAGGTAPAPAFVQRTEVIDELYHRFASEPGGIGSIGRQFRYWRKRVLWQLVVGGARGLRRLLDIVVSGGGLLVLSPLFAVVAAAIKLTDGHLVVSVTDNGQGFASNKPVAAMPPQDAPACVGRGLAGSGQGLENMRQRLGALRGELILNDVNGAGAQVILRVPLAAVR